MPPAPVLVATALAVALPAAGCGRGQPVEARDGRVAVALDDFSIAPQRIAAARGSLRIAVRNRGRINHTLALQRDGTEPGRLARSLRPGGAGELRVALAPGEYAMVCVIANHEELGMSGTLSVR